MHHKLLKLFLNSIFDVLQSFFIDLFEKSRFVDEFVMFFLENLLLQPPPSQFLHSLLSSENQN